MFFIINAIHPAVASRAEPGRWHDAKQGESTTDSDIIARRVLYIDIDAKRPKGTSSTHEQLLETLKTAGEIYEHLACLLSGEDALAIGMSGNGAAVLVALDNIPESPELGAHIRGILASLKALYARPGVEIDTAVSDAKRLCPAWGTTKRKGRPGDPERPHRRTAILCPETVRRIDMGGLAQVLSKLGADLSEHQLADVDRAMGRRPPALPAAPQALHLRRCYESESPFARANACDVREVARRLGLLEGDAPRCPGCGTVGDSSVSFINNGLKCLHQRCVEKGAPSRGGFRTPVDLVCEVQNVRPIEAVERIAGWFGFDMPERQQREPTARPVGSAPHPDGLREERQHLEGACLALPDLEPPDRLAPVPTLTPDMLPDPFRDWLTDIAERIGCPLDYPAIGGITAAGAVIGRSVGIRPKRNDSWLVVPNLWALAVGRPGVMKTPALEEALAPLKRLVAEAFDVHSAAMERFKLDDAITKAKLKAAKAQIAKLARDGATLGEETLTQLRELEKSKPPVLRRYLTNDPSVEKLGELLNENPRGLLLFRDEIVGLLRTFDREGHENDRAFYLEAWSGTGDYTYDRIGRGTVRIEACCVSLLGGIQPDVLAEHLRAAVHGSAANDGMVQRFQLAVFPDDVPWLNVDRWPNKAARDRAFGIFRALDALDGEEIGAQRDDLQPIPFLRFLPSAQPVFDEWRERLEAAVRDPAEHPAVLSHLAKYRSLMPSLALIFHILDAIDGQAYGAVTPEAAHLAVRWCHFLEAHMRRMYQLLGTGERRQPSSLLAAKLREGLLPATFTARDVYRKCWTGLTEAEEVNRALDTLVTCGWLRSEKRRTVVYHINPKVRNAP